MTSRLRCTSAVVALLLIGACASAPTKACAFADMGERHVAETVDGRSFRLTDGRKIRLAEIEPAASDACRDKATARSRISSPVRT